MLGGARSGKSRYAQHLAEASGLSPVLVATATAGDAEMAERIARHRADRDLGRWRTIEEPLALAETVRREARDDVVLLVDCLTLWLSNLMCGDDDAAAEEQLVTAIAAAAGPVVLVSNEVGMASCPRRRGTRFPRPAGSPQPARGRDVRRCRLRRGRASAPAQAGGRTARSRMIIPA